MLESLVSCGVSSHPHPAVVLVFFELVVRYETFFLVEPRFVTPTLIAFLGGMRLPNPKVRCKFAVNLIKKVIKLIFMVSSV